MTEGVHFLLLHGYSVLFLAALADQAGLPLPSTPFLIAAGALAGLGRLSLAHVFLLAVVASVLGDSLWFCLGRLRGSSMLHWLSRVSLEPEILESRARRFYRRYGAGALLVAKFLPGVSPLAPALAGLFRLRLWQFVAVDVAAGAVWSGFYTGLGWEFRDQLEILAAPLERFGLWIGALAVVALALFVIVKYGQRRRLYRRLRIERVTPDELKRKLDQGEPLVLVDLRAETERSEGIIPGAMVLDVQTQEDWLAADTLPEIVFYCSCPNEFASAREALRLLRLGARRVRPLEGGFPQWQRLGFPISAQIRAAGVPAGKSEQLQVG